MTTVYLMAHRAFLGGGDREPSAASVAAALFCGIATGATGVMAIFAISALFSGIGAMTAGNLLLVFGAGSLVLGVLTLVVGAPGWWILHVLGARGWASAVGLGLAASAAFFVLMRGGGGPLRALVLNAPMIALAGLVGLVIWKVAYNTTLAQARLSEL